jgi:hypothetical protein
VLVVPAGSSGSMCCLGCQPWATLHAQVGQRWWPSHSSSGRTSLCRSPMSVTIMRRAQYYLTFDIRISQHRCWPSHRQHRRKQARAVHLKPVSRTERGRTLTRFYINAVQAPTSACDPGRWAQWAGSQSTASQVGSSGCGLHLLP